MMCVALKSHTQYQKSIKHKGRQRLPAVVNQIIKLSIINDLFVRVKPRVPLQKQLRCTYEISSLADSITEKLTSFVLIQIIPTYVPFVVMVTTSVLVYVQIRRSIDR